MDTSSNSNTNVNTNTNTNEIIVENTPLPTPTQPESLASDVAKDVAEGLVGGTKIIVHDLAEIAVTIAEKTGEAAETVVEATKAALSTENTATTAATEMTALEKEVWELVMAEWNGKSTVSPGEILRVAIHLMQSVEKYQQISGPDRKKVVLGVLNHAARWMASAGKFPADVGAAAVTYITTILPDVIDTIVSVDKKEFVINTRRISRCFWANCLFCWRNGGRRLTRENLDLLFRIGGLPPIVNDVVTPILDMIETGVVSHAEEAIAYADAVTDALNESKSG